MQATAHSELELWLALALTPELSARSALRLVEVFGQPANVFTAPREQLQGLRLSAKAIDALLAGKSLRRAEKELARARQLGVQLVCWSEAAYPPLLRRIYDPPPVLYLRGDPAVLQRHQIAIVGTRRPTPYGAQMAERLGRELAEHGLTITSGLARGIDTMAHRGALAAVGGTTVGVLGCGIDLVYPKENHKLFDQIVGGRGVIVSELPLGTPPVPQNFPVRNRLIAGLALGVVVVEGAQHSGSLITARLAMESDREVYAVPGNVTQPTSFGPNQLIKQGAKLVTGWEDVIDELPTPIRAELVPVQTTDGAGHASLVEETLSPVERTLYQLLSPDQARHIDELVEQSGLSSSETLAALFELEIKGLVRQLPGKQFVRTMLA